MNKYPYTVYLTAGT